MYISYIIIIYPIINKAFFSFIIVIINIFLDFTTIITLQKQLKSVEYIIEY